MEINNHILLCGYIFEYHLHTHNINLEYLSNQHFHKMFLKRWTEKNVLYNKWEINHYEHQEAKFSFSILMSQFGISVWETMVKLCKHGNIPYLLLI